MKKISLFILATIMLLGCSHGGITSTFMITRDNQLYALYNQDGKKLTEYQYKTFKEIDGVGYIVTNDKDEKGFINLNGKQTIPFGTYETLEPVAQMIYATKKLEKEEAKKLPQTDIFNNNLFVLNGDGDVLHTASQQKQIKKSQLPIIIENGKYTVLYKDGKTLIESPEEVVSASQYKNGVCSLVNFKDHSDLYDFFNDEEKGEIIKIKETGNFKILGVDETLNKSCILYDKDIRSLICIDRENKKVYQNTIAVDQAEYDDLNNIVLKQGQKVFVYEIGKKPILMTSYYQNANNYLVRSDVVYGPHQVYLDGKTTGDIENCQLYPAPYHISGTVFPVYVKKKGFVFYGFDNKQVFKDVYLDAEPFDLNKRAIVEVEKGYSLIDDSGSAVTSKTYAQIKYIGSSYYAVYNENGKFGVIDTSGSEVLPVEYTTLPETAFVNYNGEEYLLLGKNGRSYIYDTKHDMEEVFSIEGTLVFEEKGYFSMGNVYYTFDGEVIE